MSILKSAEVVAEQYKNSSKFDSRVRLYEQYSSNEQSWMDWLYDCLRLVEGECVLELGTGTGNVWRVNQERIPAKVRIIPSDLSAAMLEQARERLGGQRPILGYSQCDAQRIPFPNETFDVVLANHMLYHVADRATAIAEAHRVLKRGGRLYVGTNDWTHLQELREVVARFKIESVLLPPGRDPDFFDLENAAEELSLLFPRLRLYRRQDSLPVTEVEPLLDYIQSSLKPGTVKGVAAFAALGPYLKRYIALLGTFHVSVSVGVFEATKSREMAARQAEDTVI